MASCVELLDALQHRAFHDPKVRRQLLATRQEKDPFGAFCRTCRELGYEIYEMDLICAGEECGNEAKYQRRRGKFPDAGG